MRACHDRIVRGVAGAALGATLALVGCRPTTSLYIVTSAPLQVGSGPGMCIAVDPRDAHGVWWWEPGSSGCTTRSTGPTIVEADQAVVTPSATPDVLAVAFRLQLHSATPPSFLDVRLIVEQDRMRTLDYRAAVAVHRRRDLAIPAEPPR